MVYTLRGQRLSSSSSCSRCHEHGIACSRGRDYTVKWCRDAARKVSSDWRSTREARIARLKEQERELMEKLGRLRKDGESVADMRYEVEALRAEPEALEAESKAATTIKEENEGLQVELTALLGKNEVHRSGLPVDAETARQENGVSKAIVDNLSRPPLGIRIEHRRNIQLEACRARVERLEQDMEKFRLENAQLAANRRKIKQRQRSSRKRAQLKASKQTIKRVEEDGYGRRREGDEVQAVDKTINTLGAGLEALHQQWDESDRQKQELKRVVEHLQGEVARLKAKEETQERSARELQDAGTKLRQENGRLRAAVKDAKSKVADRHAAKKPNEAPNSSGGENAELQAQRKSLQTELPNTGDGQGELRAMQAEMGRVRMEIGSLKDLDKGNEGLRRDVTKLQKEVESVRRGQPDLVRELGSWMTR